MKSSITLCLMYLFSLQLTTSTQASEMHHTSESATKNVDLDQAELFGNSCNIAIMVAPICDTRTAILSHVNKLGANFFVKAILERLLNGACSACEADNPGLSDYYLNVFIRYLGYLKAVDDECARTRAIAQANHSKSLHCRSAICTPTYMSDVDQEQLIITVLDQELGAIQDIKSLEERSDELAKVLDEVRQEHIGQVRSQRSEKLTAYPNPATSQVNLSSVVDEVEVLSSSGQILLSMEGGQELQIGHLPAGVYTLRVRDNVHEVTTLRILKN